MGMTVGSNGGHKADINMTPMIDVLLVLIIIFMVITPLTPRGLNALIPQTPKVDEPVAPARHDIVISVGAHGAISLNQEPMNLARLQTRLSGLFKTGAADVVFVRGEKDLPFAEIAQVMDLARGAGVARIGLMTR
jgi:biopolymer transport protein TolR